MTKLIFALCCLFPLAGAAQNGYTITGRFSTPKAPVKAYLLTVKNDDWQRTDSVLIKDGKFEFKGKINEPAQVIIEVEQKGGSGQRSKTDNLVFWLENSNITLTAVDSIKNAVITGSVTDKEDRELEALITPLTEKIVRLQNEFSSDNHKPVVGKTPAERKNASDSLQSYVAQIRKINLKFIETHTDSFLALYTFNNYILNGHFDPVEANPLFYKFSSRLQASSLGKLVIDRIRSAQKRGLGIKIIDFTQTDLNGKIFDIRSLRGKYVFLDFWASWCYWCRAENPNVLKAYEQLKGRNLEIVSVSFDEKRSSWEGAVKQDKLPWLQVSDLKGMKVRDGLAARLDITAIPQNLLINPDGVIIAVNLRGEDLPVKLAALIK